MVRKCENGHFYDVDDEKSKFCPYCGYRFITVDRLVPGQDESPNKSEIAGFMQPPEIPLAGIPAPPPPPEEKKFWKRHFRLLLISGIAVSAVILTVLLLIFLRK